MTRFIINCELIPLLSTDSSETTSAVDRKIMWDYLLCHVWIDVDNLRGQRGDNEPDRDGRRQYVDNLFPRRNTVLEETDR